MGKEIPEEFPRHEDETCTCLWYDGPWIHSELYPHYDWNFSPGCLKYVKRISNSFVEVDEDYLYPVRRVQQFYPDLIGPHHGATTIDNFYQDGNSHFEKFIGRNDDLEGHSE